MDLTENWIIECDVNQGRGTPSWDIAWETWFLDDDEEVERIEREYGKQKKKWAMQPRGIQACLEILNVVRPDKTKWDQIRLRNVQTGDIILAWVLR